MSSALLAGIATYVALTPDGVRLVYSPSSESLIVQSGEASSAIGDAPPLGIALSRYLAAARWSDVTELQAEIKRVSGLQRSYVRDRELESLLLRYVELDAAGSVQFAQSQSLDASFIVLMFRSWMAFDSVAALEALAAVDSPALITAVALAIVDSDVNELDQLSQLLSPENRAGFRSDALVRLAESDPELALASALEFRGGEAMQTRTVQRIAAKWARRDPRSALSLMASISGDTQLRNRFHMAVVREWARVDPDRALEYLSTEAGQELFSLHTAKSAHLLANALALRRPHELLAVADDLPTDVRQPLRLAALQSIVDSDFNAALTRIDAMPIGVEREEWLRAVAASYMRRDLRAAIKWAERVENSSPGTTRRMLQEAALVDLPGAVDAALDIPNGIELVEEIIRVRGRTAGTAIVANVQHLQAVASSLKAAGAPGREALDSLLEVWPQLDPNAARAWLSENGGLENRRQVGAREQGDASVGSSVRPELVEGLPQESPGVLIARSAGLNAVNDLDGTLTWLSAYQNEPGYDDWIATAATSIVASRPDVAAALLKTARAPAQGVVTRVVRQWARERPKDAAEWAMRLSDADARSVGLAAAVRTWSAADPAAGRSWALALSAGAIRDTALGAVIAQGIASQGSVDREVLGAFSSSGASRRALDSASSAFLALAERDRARALDLAETYLGQDSELRRRIASGP